MAKTQILDLVAVLAAFAFASALVISAW